MSFLHKRGIISKAKGGVFVGNYQYRCLTERGYTRFKITKKQHNEIFKNRKIKWTDRYEYYYNENNIIMHKFYSKKLIVLFTILFPLIVLFTGISNIKESYSDLKRMLNQKKYGSFVSEYVHKQEAEFEKLRSVIKNKRKGGR